MNFSSHKMDKVLTILLSFLAVSHQHSWAKQLALKVKTIVSCPNLCQNQWEFSKTVRNWLIGSYTSFELFRRSQKNTKITWTVTQRYILFANRWLFEIFKVLSCRYFHLRFSNFYQWNIWDSLKNLQIELLDWINWFQNIFKSTISPQRILHKPTMFFLILSCKGRHN